MSQNEESAAGQKLPGLSSLGFIKHTWGCIHSLSYIFKRDKLTLGPEPHSMALLSSSSIFLRTQKGLSSFYVRQQHHPWILSSLMCKLQALSWSRFCPLYRLFAARSFKCLLRNPNGDFLKSVFLP